jgi:hypothetical protein
VKGGAHKDATGGVFDRHSHTHGSRHRETGSLGPVTVLSQQASAPGILDNEWQWISPGVRFK